MCTPEKRTYFNQHLLEFLEEWRSEDPSLPTHPPSGALPEPSAEPKINTPEKGLVYWAFDKLDSAPYDRVLGKNELAPFLAVIQREVGPRACAESFLRHCDYNNDSYIGLLEWCHCTGFEPPADSTEDEKDTDPQGECFHRFMCFNPMCSFRRKTKLLRVTIALFSKAIERVGELPHRLPLFHSMVIELFT